MADASALAARVRGVDASWLSVPVGVGLAALVVAYAPLSPDAAAMLAITAFCVSLWVGTPVPPWLTGLVGIGLVGVRFSTELALVGFGSAATWLVVLGILIGEATRHSGLSTLVERRVFDRMPGHARSDPTTAYRYLLGAFSLVALAFVVLVPSALVRVLILGPILVSAGECFSERRPRVGLFLGPLFVTFYGAAGVLTGSLGNIIVAGIVESTTGVSLGWVEWLTWLAPVMSLARSAVVVAVAYVLYRPRNSGTVSVDAGAADERPDANPDDGDASTDATDGGEEPIDASDARRMLAFLSVGVAVWATDAIHGLHPVYGALVVVVLAFLPRIGVVDVDAVADADFSVVFFLGAVFAIAEGLQRTDFTAVAADRILSLVPGGASLPVVLAAVAVATLALMFVMEGMAVASVLTPVFISFAQGAGVPILPVAMTESVVLLSYFFPYQSAVLVAMLGLGATDTRELVRMATVCSLLTLLVLLPVQILLFALFV
ncbi:SLC13 family permease [Halogeometricum sp. S1BR25-6]|uniref:SLC13 family permease n=1 Tax=Halogeometricum salsisoli TaxID=2950536 RepID=A0ABU2GKG5_9EURY|nr:SLC13 family permease [Halogeometricum sp. S1BR25-6]MDS0300684.1 SLC13 family permease [Halogeometricum sp. S1BR25-6]